MIVCNAELIVNISLRNPNTGHQLLLRLSCAPQRHSTQRYHFKDVDHKEIISLLVLKSQI